MADTPKIRFRGFTDAWEQRKVGDISTIIAGGTPSTKEISYWEPKEIPWLSSGEVHKKYIYDTDDMISEKGLNNSSAKWVEKDSVLIALAGQGKTRGTVAITRRPITTNQSIAAIKFDDIICPDYAFQNLDSRYEKLRNISSGDGTRGGLNKQLLSDLDIMFPSLEEQIKIGNYFRTLDRLITLHQHKCDDTKELKKYMLQKMFPQNGKKIPEIRFAGFTDAWEQRKFGDLADYKKGPFGSALKKDMFVPRNETTVKVYEQQNAINKDWTLERYFITKEYAQKLSGFKVEGGNIIVSCAGTIGEIYEIPMDAESGIINQALMRIKVNEFIVDKKMFLILFTNMIDDFTRVHSNGSAIKNIPPFSDLKSMEVLIPKMEEQKKISEYITNLDHLITLHQRKCNELKEVKRFMLQNMFPQKG